MAHSKEVRAYVSAYFASKLPPQKLSVTFSNLAIDSLDLLDFIVGLEKKFGVQIDVHRDLRTSMTLDAFCEIVAAKI